MLLLELEHAMEWALDDKYLGLAEEETPDKMAPQIPGGKYTALEIIGVVAAIAAAIAAIAATIVAYYCWRTSQEGA